MRGKLYHLELKEQNYVPERFKFFQIFSVLHLPNTCSSSKIKPTKSHSFLDSKTLREKVMISLK